MPRSSEDRCRPMTTLRSVRSGLYRGASLLGDVNAARSPSTAIRRVARKGLWRTVSRALGRLG